MGFGGSAQRPASRRASHRALVAAAAALLAGPAPSRGATPEGAAKSDRTSTAAPDSAAPSDGETVYTFYGLLALEKDPDVTDSEKVEQWRAFVERTEQQLRYAREAAQRWRDAARRRAIEAALAVEEDATTTAPDRMQAWLAAAAAQSEASPRERATKRAEYWRAAQTRALVERARRVESSREPKVERIAAWRRVVDWHGEGSAAEAARARMRALGDQLFREAQNIDDVSGVDAATTLEAWRDVLAGDPTPAQRARAEARVRALAPR